MLTGENGRAAGGPALKAPAGTAALRFWLLTGFLFLVVLCGGSASADELQLVVLRPAAVLVAAIALLTMRAEHWRRYRPVWLLLGAVMVLTLLHLVPLPPQLWQALPGRDIIVDIDRVAMLGEQWRPLSMAPERTANAAFALAIPIAVALLAAQLDDALQNRLLIVVVGLAILSGSIGLVQATGTGLQFYPEASAIAGAFANRNHQGLLLALTIPMAAVWAARTTAGSRSTRNRAIMLIAAVIVIVPLIALTASRSAIALAAVGLASLALLRTGSDGQAAPGARRAMLVAAAWIASALAVAAILYATAVNRFTTFDRLENASDDARLTIWSSTFDMIGHYLPWGSGIGGYARVYQILEPASLLEPSYTNHAHNEWLEIAMTAGIPGLVILVAAGAMFGVAAWRSLRRSNVPNLDARLGVIVIFMLAIASTADYPVRTPILSAILAIAAVWSMPGNFARREASAV